MSKREMIAESERADFNAAVKKLGYSPASFDVFLGGRIQTDRGDGTYSINETVAVHHKGSDVLEEYRGGDREAWAYAAIEDVKNGKFGPPDMKK